MKAKFKVSEYNVNELDKSASILLTPVWDNTPEAKTLSDDIPSGHIALHISAEKEAQEHFEINKEYIVEFKPVE